MVNSDAARAPWLPTDGIRTVPCARWFDAVQVDAFDAGIVIGRMRHRSGPVIEDQVEDTVTWFVRVGTADAWRLPAVQVYGRGHEIRIPPPGWHGTIRWLMEPPAVGDCLTSTELLHTTLTAVLGERRRWNREGRRG